MIDQKTLDIYLSDFLNINTIKDYCPNGLQIEGKNSIQKIITGVTASQKLIDYAIDQKADALLVHHGFFWKGESSVITGIKKQRIKKLLDHNINLFAYHLPLDIHPEIGNNIALIKQLDLDENLNFSNLQSLPLNNIPNLINYIHLKTPLSINYLKNKVIDNLKREPLIIYPDNINLDTKISRISWCTGAAQDFIEAVSKYNIDVYISGEISERTTHLARELGIVYIAAGHHATERYGVKLLGEHLKSKFDLNIEFKDIDNPV